MDSPAEGPLDLGSRIFISGRPITGDLERTGVPSIQLICDLIASRVGHQIGFGAAQAKRLPDQVDDIANPDFLEAIPRLQRRADALQEFVVTAHIFTPDQ